MPSNAIHDGQEDFEIKSATDRDCLESHYKKPKIQKIFMESKTPLSTEEETEDEALSGRIEGAHYSPQDESDYGHN